MSTPSALGIGLSATAVLQAAAPLVLDKAAFLERAYRAVFDDQTGQYQADGIRKFFVEDTEGKERAGVVVRVGTLAARAASQLAAFATVAIGLVVLIVVAFADHRALAWQISTVAVLIACAVTAGVLYFRTKGGKLRDYHRVGSPWTDHWNTPKPYGLVIIAAATFGIIAGAFLSS